MMALRLASDGHQYSGTLRHSIVCRLRDVEFTAEPRLASFRRQRAGLASFYHLRFARLRNEAANAKRFTRR